MLPRTILLAFDQEEQVRNSFQGIIDLVRDGSSEPSHGSQFLGLEQRLFDSLLLRDVEIHSRHLSRPVFLVGEHRSQGTHPANLTIAAYDAVFSIVATGLEGSGNT